MEKSTIILTRRIQLVLDVPSDERNEMWEKLYRYQNRCYRAANFIVSHLYVQEMMKDFFYFTEDIQYKLADINKDEMKTEIKTKIVSKKPMVAIGSGGNINKIFSMSKTKDGKPMSANMLKTFYKDLKELTVEERMLKHNLREDRADVIVPALEIFNKVLNWAEISQIFVPKISVADGLIHSIYDKVKK
jgi:exopolyphosphatase/pppGpp-phosphohydrolase